LDATQPDVIHSTNFISAPYMIYDLILKIFGISSPLIKKNNQGFDIRAVSADQTPHFALFEM
jgi:hypothetical protein